MDYEEYEGDIDSEKDEDVYDLVGCSPLAPSSLFKQAVTPPSCESANLGEMCFEPLPSSCANSPVVPILKRAFGAVSLEWAWGPGELTVDVERGGFANKELEALLVACWSLVERATTCWAPLELPLAMEPVVELVEPVAVPEPSFLLLLLLLSSELPPTSTNAPADKLLPTAWQMAKTRKDPDDLDDVCI